MKRVVCLLLSLILLLGLLPTALADGNGPNWVVLCNEDGTEREMRRTQELYNCMYGESVYFHLYADETGGTPVEGLTQTFYVDGETVHDPAKPDYKVKVSWDAEKKYYVWDTNGFSNNKVQISLGDGTNNYSFFANLTIEDIGWFWSRNPSVASAIPGGRAVTAKYDGSQDVSVYLMATHTTAGAVLSDDYEAPEGFTVRQLTQYCWRVTCKADESWKGEKKKLTLYMDKAWTSIFDLGTDYTVTFCADGNEPRGKDAPAPSVIGQLAAIPVTINGRKRTCYMGVGEYNNGKYGVLTTSSMGGLESADMRAQLAVGLWWQTSSGDGTYDLTALSADEVQKVIRQVGEFTLTVRREDGQAGTLTYTDDTAAAASTGMPCSRVYTLHGTDAGTWVFEASCMVDGQRMAATGSVTREIMKVHTLTGAECKTVGTINKALEEVIYGIDKNDTRDQTIIVQLRKTGTQYDAQDAEYSAYLGQIKIPDIERNNITVQLIGEGGIGTTLIGGIHSESADFSVSNINFVGDGQDHENWQVPDKNHPNGGAPNKAFYGNSRGNARDCTFTGYHVAIECGKGLRMIGQNNVFKNNHIAWKLTARNNNGGNPSAHDCVFEDNEYALWVENFHLAPSWYAPRFCEFINNDCDVHNVAGRWWFLPGNYFKHGNRERPVNDEISIGKVFCYPMAKRDETNNNAVAYTYQQLENGGDTVSNALTNTYQTPKSELSGKTFKVADTVMVAGTEKDTVLATFSFDDTAAEQAEEKPVRSVLRARMLRSVVEPSFDATVSVDRSDASKIEFTMQDPCKQVNVSLPCEFKDGTVKLGETEIPDAKFDGQTVFFQTDEAGTYVIESKTPVQPKPDDAVTGIISSIVASGALQPGASASQFADLTSGSWYYDGVRCALENGLMTGTSARTFAPDRPVTRAMLVTILWRLAGEPYGRVSPFEDVLPGSWYAQAVSWAYDKGIVTGVTATSFQPGAPVTREQLCAILCRYAALTGKNTAASASLDAFTDRAQVSAYAEASARWALQAGLLTGVGDGRLAPRSGATRAQLAVLLQRFAGLK
ncbi:MAG: S-layer homology domain-containing protein [Oscillospiraceae bacterium]